MDALNEEIIDACSELSGHGSLGKNGANLYKLVDPKVSKTWFKETVFRVTWFKRKRLC